EMEFSIKHTWDGLPVSHEPVPIGLRPDSAGLLMEVHTPFFNDRPAPPGEPGKPFGGLWDYEAWVFLVGWFGLFQLFFSTFQLAFFLSGRTEQYLEVELCLHGQYLLLLLSGRRKAWKEELPLEFEVTRMKTKWEGKVLLPWRYFPPCTDNFNVFAIHGSGEERKYEVLYPVPPHELQEGQEPDFHRLEFFEDLNLEELTGEDWKQPESDIWKSLTK
ncbi:CD033 protein, partial [Certhia brachydactyla]|nr:CD033 protein [Certhia brachydactyla]